MSVKTKKSIRSLKAKFTEITGYEATSDNVYYLARKDRLYFLALAATAEMCVCSRLNFARKQTWIDYIEALEQLIGGND